MLSNTLWKCRTTSGSELSTMALNTQHSVTVQMYRAHGPAVALQMYRTAPPWTGSFLCFYCFSFQEVL